jgi:hypothetical protein
MSPEQAQAVFDGMTAARAENEAKRVREIAERNRRREVADSLYLALLAVGKDTQFHSLSSGTRDVVQQAISAARHA